MTAFGKLQQEINMVKRNVSMAQTILLTTISISDLNKVLQKPYKNLTGNNMNYSTPTQITNEFTIIIEARKAQLLEKLKGLNKELQAEIYQKQKKDFDLLSRLKIQNKTFCMMISLYERLLEPIQEPLKKINHQLEEANQEYNNACDQAEKIYNEIDATRKTNLKLFAIIDKYLTPKISLLDRLDDIHSKQPTPTNLINEIQKLEQQRRQITATINNLIRNKNKITKTDEEIKKLKQQKQQLIKNTEENKTSLKKQHYLSLDALYHLLEVIKKNISNTRDFKFIDKTNEHTGNIQTHINWLKKQNFDIAFSTHNTARSSAEIKINNLHEIKNNIEITKYKIENSPIMHELRELNKEQQQIEKCISRFTIKLKLLLNRNRLICYM